jgi:hypothetical protein
MNQGNEAIQSILHLMNFGLERTAQTDWPQREKRESTRCRALGPKDVRPTSEPTKLDRRSFTLDISGLHLFFCKTTLKYHSLLIYESDCFKISRHGESSGKRMTWSRQLKCKRLWSRQ